jgi:hypothetical protein
VLLEHLCQRTDGRQRPIELAQGLHIAQLEHVDSTTCPGGFKF